MAAKKTKGCRCCGVYPVSPGTDQLHGDVARGLDYRTCLADQDLESGLRRAQALPCTKNASCCVILAYRSLVANLSAANKFDPAHLNTEKAKDMVESARFFYIAGFFLTVSVDAIVTVAKHAVEKSKVHCTRKKRSPRLRIR